ncbi:hypothetical protein K505DRAFT_310363 [Melanomma pulvis-pyrius CBS 109.77]|uniref:Trichothecene 3-O-acetyltransferas-like protein n=1 Tax=Melanomma pulvis-pyrius CBS 109.77 TaxID=1314802 RepID=A0A6A6X422_9PLEO|nr:hypothetical protein K505DRAFT_310363 [Melanomma pulvis-pyrius CBS 109.77]
MNTTFLSPLDQIMPRNHIRIALVFPTNDYNLALSNLQNGLQRTCEALPFLKGRIFNKSSDRDQLAISWDASSSAPIIREQPAPDGYPGYAKLLENAGSSEPYAFSLFPFMERGKENGEEGAEVFGVACVKIEGGLVLFMSMHHNVTDGPGFGEFVKFWARNTSLRDFPASELRPNTNEISTRKAKILEQLSYTLKEGYRTLTVAGILAKHSEYTVRLPSAHPEQTVPSAVLMAPSSSRIFTFSYQKLNAVKTSLANAINPSFLTINNILSAIIWSHISHIRCTRPSSPEPSPISRLGFAVNGRRILNLLSPPYLGNVAFLAQAELPMSSISAASHTTEDGLVPIISTIATATRQIDRSHIAELTQLPNLLPSLSDLVFGWNILGGPHLSITSWAELGLYDANFGDTLGKPQMVRVPDVPRDGLIIILPRRREQGTEEKIEIAVYLRKDDAERLDKDDTWRRWYA